MSATEKSDLPEVARKRANKTASAAAELVERRGGAKENADLQSTGTCRSHTSCIRGRSSGSSSPSEVGAQCVSSARRDLCGLCLASALKSAV